MYTLYSPYITPTYTLEAGRQLSASIVRLRQIGKSVGKVAKYPCACSNAKRLLASSATMLTWLSCMEPRMRVCGEVSLGSFHPRAGAVLDMNRRRMRCLTLCPTQSPGHSLDAGMSNRWSCAGHPNRGERGHFWGKGAASDSSSCCSLPKSRGLGCRV